MVFEVDARGIGVLAPVDGAVVEALAERGPMGAGGGRPTC